MKAFRNFGIALVLTVLSLLGTTAFAEVTLFAQGAWYVTSDERSGVMNCSAVTVNTRPQWFGFTGWDDGAAVILLVDPSWNLRRREVDFVISIDGSNWDVTGNASGERVAIEFRPTDTTSAFLDDIASGYQLTVLNEDGQSVAAFSLSGSRAAIGAFFACWADLGQISDPF